MLTYLVRPRGLYLEPEGAVIEFPANVRLEFQYLFTALLLVGIRE